MWRFYTQAKKNFQPIYKNLFRDMTWALTIMRIATSSSGTAAGLQVASQPDEIFIVMDNHYPRMDDPAGYGFAMAL